MKYEIGDFVSEPVIGICKIEDILYLNPQDERNNKLYLIKPIEDEKEKNICSGFKLRFKIEIMSDKRRSMESDQTNSGDSAAWINNEKMREQNYKEAVKANDPEALVAIIKMIYQRKQKKTCTGEKVYGNGCKVFPDSRKSVIHGTGSCYWKTQKRSM